MRNYSIMIVGNGSECRTEAEVIRVFDDKPDRLMAIVYENEQGWQCELEKEETATPDDAELDAAVSDAKEALAHYVNRMGSDQPEGLTRAGLAFWLMIKDDGTAMGEPTSFRT